MAPRPAYGFFIRQNERTAIGNQETEPCPRTPCGSTGTCPGPGLIGSSRRRIRTNNMIERLNREIRRRTRVVGGFPDGNSALMLICARIRHVTANEWSTRRYLDMSRLGDNLVEAN